MATISELLAKLADAVSDMFPRRTIQRRIGHEPTQASGRNHAGSNNHSQSESKKRKKMADASRKRNRKK